MLILQEMLFMGLATAAVMAAALLLSLVRGFSAALRSRILAWAFLAGLLLPLLTHFLPAPTNSAPAPPVAEAKMAAKTGTANFEALSAPAASVLRQPDAGAPMATTGPAVWGLEVWGFAALAVVWLLVAGSLLARLVDSHRQAHRLWQKADPVGDLGLQRLCERLSAGIGYRGRVPLRTSPLLAGPLAVGLVRPGILWPVWPAHLEPEAEESVLRHELAHIVRRDNLVHLMAGLVVCGHWLNPLVWLAWRRLRFLSEQACDDQVLAGGVRPSAYAAVLLEHFRRLSDSQPALLKAPSSAFAWKTRDRLVSLLDAGTNRRLPGRRANFLTVALFLVLVLPLTAFRPGVVAVAAAGAQTDPFRFLGVEEEQTTGKEEWLEIVREWKEAKALNRWQHNPSVAAVLPEGTSTHPDGWTMECHDALALAGAKYGCIFTSDEGFVRFSGSYQGLPFMLSVAAVKTGPPNEEDLFLDRIAGYFGLGVNEHYRAYQLQCRFEARPGGFDESIRQVFQALIEQAARTQAAGY